jgi:thiol-disulfide isomerase/thioredoxin
LLGVLGGVVALAAALSLAAAGDDEPEATDLPGGTIPTGETVVPSTDDGFGAVAVNGAALPEAGEGADPATGLAAPTVEGAGLDGTPVTAPVPGEPTVVMFVAHWCPHCQAEVPRIAEWLAAEGMPEGVELVTVATANQPSAGNFPAGAWLHREGWPVPTVLDDEAQTAAEAYGVAGFPYFVAVDAEGTVVARASGEIGVAGVEELIAAARA